MEILIALPSDNLSGGAEHILYLIAKYYSQIPQTNVHVLFMMKPTGANWSALNKYDNVKLYYTSAKRRITGITKFVRNLFALRKIKFSYVFSTFPEITGLLGILRKVHILKTTYFIGREKSMHFIRLRKFTDSIAYKFYLKTGYQALDLLICQTQDMKNNMLHNASKQLKDINLKVIQNPFDKNEAEKIFNTDVKFSLDSSYNYIIAAGRLEHIKGFDILIRAFKNILLKSRTNKLKLIILGEGSERQYLESLINSLDISDNVLLPGFAENVYYYFNIAKVCVVSSLLEGFPNVLIQEMYLCDNVVSTLCAGDINNIKGLITCEPGSPKSLEHAINKALNLNSSQLKENRLLYDKELATRSVEAYIKTIEDSVIKI